MLAVVALPLLGLRVRISARLLLCFLLCSSSRITSLINALTLLGFQSWVMYLAVFRALLGMHSVA